MTELHLTTEQYQAIVRSAAASYPVECCGILLGRRQFGPANAAAEVSREVVQVVATENAWAPSLLGYTDAERDSGQEHSLGDRYWIDPAVLLQVQRSARDQGLEVLGIYHSHPDHPAVPSECDRALAWPVYSYVIVSVVKGQVADFTSWRLDDHHQFQREPVKMIKSSANKAPFLS
jgi:proteasome lid subunit RPN8/RPN11